MRYTAISPSVEAAGVVLADRQHFAVQVGDGAVVVPAAAFLALYELADPVISAPEPVRHKRRKAKPAQKASGRPSPLTDAIMGVIEAETLVTSEVVDHVCREIGCTRNSVSARLQQLAKAGRIEKREQPETRLDKWYVTGGL